MPRPNLKVTPGGHDPVADIAAGRSTFLAATKNGNGNSGWSGLNFIGPKKKKDLPSLQLLGSATLPGRDTVAPRAVVLPTDSSTLQKMYKHLKDTGALVVEGEDVSTKQPVSLHVPFDPDRIIKVKQIFLAFSDLHKKQESPTTAAP